MGIELDTDKTASQNAGDLFTRAKKLEDKAEKSKLALTELDNRIEALKKKKVEVAVKILKERRKPGKWFEKFRWFYSTSGKLIIGGRDATTNDIMMKKHVDNDELVFHADIVGAPFVTIKAKPSELSEDDIQEAAEAAGIFSRAWKLGYGAISVYYSPREKFTKQAPSGEHVKKGAFMVYGKKEWKTVKLQAGVGIKGELVTAGPVAPIKKWAERIVIIEPGHLKQGEITKKVVKKLKAKADDVQRALPAGKTQIIKNNK